jgi:hypothetical protein
MVDPPISFLSLPPAVRRDVYILAGLKRICPLVIRREQPASGQPQQQDDPPIPGAHGVSRADCRYKRLLRGNWSAVYQYQPDCSCPGLPKQLLLVSKAVYNDARAILYGENKFAVRAHKARDLDVLKTLSGRSIQEMTCLMLRLNCWPCPRGHDLANLAHGRCMVCNAPTSTSDYPLVAGRSSEAEDMLQAWAKVCAVLTSQVRAGRLCLTLICDVDDIDTAERVVKPLFGIPRLKSCTIRLGRRRDEKLRSLARVTSLKLTDTYQHAGPGSSRISFASLPPEIRLRILRFTHLGEWGSFSGKHTGLLIEEQTLVQRVGPARKPLKMCCHCCSFTKKDCCCPVRYAAYSDSCQCRVLPLETLRVSRQMNMDASEILYSTNTFVFRGAFADTLRFLRSLRPSTLKLFRRICLALMDNQSRNWSKREENWSAIIRLIRDNFCLSALTITVDASCDEETAMWADEDDDLLAEMRQTYVDISRVVKDMLVGLKSYRLILGIDQDRYHRILSVDKELASLLEAP